MAMLCKNCAGTLIFDPEKQKLICKVCGSEYLAEEIEDSSKDLEAEAGKFRNANIYVCNHCGSEIELNDSESSSFCLYCGNPAIVFDRIAQTKCPDKIIPFKITKEQAQAKLVEKLKKSFGRSKREKQFVVEKIRGIYIPYWRVDGTLYDQVEFRTDIGSNDHSKIIYTNVVGKMDIEDFPVYGSDKLPPQTLYITDVWDFNEAVPFDEDYLAGFFSDVADTDIEDIKKKVEQRADLYFKKAVMHEVRGSFRGYSLEDPRFEFSSVPEYVFVPMWFLTLQNQDGTRTTFIMNAQTGQCSGTFPVSAGKFWLNLLKKTAVFSIFAITAALIVNLLFREMIGVLLAFSLMALFAISGFACFTIIADLIIFAFGYFRSKFNKGEEKSTEYSLKRREI